MHRQALLVNQFGMPAAALSSFMLATQCLTASKVCFALLVRAIKLRRQDREWLSISSLDAPWQMQYGSVAQRGAACLPKIVVCTTSFGM